jgi:Co/Zn/Cd efflux system component
MKTIILILGAVVVGTLIARLIYNQPESIQAACIGIVGLIITMMGLFVAYMGFSGRI